MIKRIFSTLFVIWCAVIFCTTMIVLLPFILMPTWFLKGKKMQDTSFAFIKLWAWLFCVFCGFRLQVKGKELIDGGKSYIYVPNHNSYLDAVIIARAVPESFKPLGKIEMVKVPIFGLIYQKVVLLIDRKSTESRAKCMADLKIELAGGQSILIFPEGTMNRGDAPVEHFYDGAFRIAIETQTPIVPMAIIGARSLLPRNNPLSLAHPGQLLAIFGAPIEVTGLNVETDLASLKEQTQKVLRELIIKNT